MFKSNFLLSVYCVILPTKENWVQTFEYILTNIGGMHMKQASRVVTGLARIIDFNGFMHNPSRFL